MLGLPKYKVGDIVNFYANGEKIGEICVIDKYGSLGNKKEPCYDIYSTTDNISYKHICESDINLVRAIEYES